MSIWVYEQRDEQRLISILTKLFQKTEEEVIISNIFYETGVTLMPKSDKDSIRKRNYMPFFTYKHKNTNYSIYKQSGIEKQCKHIKRDMIK